MKQAVDLSTLYSRLIDTPQSAGFSKHYRTHMNMSQAQEAISYDLHTDKHAQNITENISTKSPQ